MIPVKKVLSDIKLAVLSMPEKYYCKEIVQGLNGTCAQESHLGRYRKQVGGSALSIFQIEQPTFDFIYKKYDKLLRSLFSEHSQLLFEMLENDDRLATIIARLKYWTIPEAFPAYNNIPAQAAYWKKYYNTPLGKGTVEQYIENYSIFVSPYV